ncbi:Predicted O-linked N-acetylglucosamine transferase, SPINDLY family [Chromobacterium vaccinii]|nr:tetratricopeptide repeat protein [Chromobacterium vaccinii]SUX54580.1 Predicted O-linked N-acetylglucosamine transferase, SPINDLY family [Chromobacterium vaccinii]
MTPLSPDTLLAARLLAEGDLAGALRAAQAGLQAEPGNAPLWNLLGVCAARLAQLPLAEQCWRQALARDPATPDAHYNLGCLRAGQGDAAQAEAHYRSELARDPDHSSSLGNLGNLLQDAGRLAEADACFRRRLSSQPGAAAHYQLGRLLAEQGRNGEAEGSCAPAWTKHLTMPRRCSCWGGCWRRGERPDRLKPCCGARWSWRRAMPPPATIWVCC